MGRATRVLIVEDETTLRRCLARHCERRGMQVAQAGSCAEADALLDETRFDAAVLDVGLPDGDGLALLDRTGVARSLVITANPDLERFARLGVRHHLSKPVDLVEISRTLEALGCG